MTRHRHNDSLLIISGLKTQKSPLNFTVFLGFWGHFGGTGLAEEQPNSQPPKKHPFLSFLSCFLSPFLFFSFSCCLYFSLFSFFSFLAFSSSSFLFVVFCSCFDSTEVGQSKKRERGRGRREKRERTTNQKRDKRGKKRNKTKKKRLPKKKKGERRKKRKQKR